jgi:hypothetical protein
MEETYMAIKTQPICQIIFNQMSIPVYNLEQGKKALDGIFMIGETIKVERPLRKRIARKRLTPRGAVSRKDRTKARRKLVAKLFGKGLNKSQIMKETGASFITIAKDLEALGKEKETRVKGEGEPKKVVRGKGVKKARKGRSQKPVEAQEKEKK